MTNRYARQTVLPELGADGQDRLNQASVLCVGAGGLGSPALLYLSAAGIGRIGIVDDDRVDISNLQRQILFTEADTHKNKAETAAKYGEEQVLLWRRGYSIRPPELESEDSRHPRNQAKYAGIAASDLPGSESLADTLDRMLPFWNSTIVPSFKNHHTILIAAHGNSLRGIVQHLKGMNEEEILALNIPTGIPYLFELSPDGQYISDRYLIEEDELNRRMEEVKNQGKAH
jgi:broad specificity phosphatase PhoE